jgi:beta-glucosidase
MHINLLSPFLRPFRPKYFGGSLAAILVAVAPGYAPAQQAHPNAQLADPKIEARVNALLQQMTLEEKVGQLVQYGGGPVAPLPTPNKKTEKAAGDVNPEVQQPDAMALAEKGLLGSVLNTWGPRAAALQHAAVEKGRLHIPLLFGADVIHGYRTIFPIPLAMASSFDPDLIAQAAHTAGSEATTAGVKWVYSPMVDIARDARWGRVAESAGEDPYLGSAIARAYVRGFQGDDLADPESVAVSVKHYAAYGAAEAGRDYNTTDMSDIRLRQVYLKPYKAAVEAGAATLMSSFNSLNGVPASANPYLMTKILRDEWHFDGFVVSDYNAIGELIYHGIALDGATAAQKALNAGVEVDMMAHLYDRELPTLVTSGKVSQATLDEAVRRVLRVKFALGLFEHPYARPGGEVTAAVPEHLPFARKAAEESIILLKNDAANGAAPILPLRSSARKIALIGPLADAADEMAGTWAIGARNEDIGTLRTAIGNRCKQIGCSLDYQQGTDIEGVSEAGFAAAIEAAGNADVVLLALGESQGMSGEAASRAHLDLPGNQQKLLEAITKLGKPTVLVVFSGRPLVLDWAAEHVPAILEAWFLGDEVGPAITNVLFGDTNPSGRVPLSFPRAVGQEPLYYAQLPTGRPAEGRDHVPSDGSKGTKFFSRYLDVRNDALFPFGYGLSYTKFAYSDVKVSASMIPLSKANSLDHTTPLITVSATLKNIGDREGTEVAQLYVNNNGASVSQPVRLLKGFQRVTLGPGESKQLTFNLGFDELSFYNVESKPVMEPTHYTVWIGGDSVASQSATFNVVQ